MSELPAARGASAADATVEELWEHAPCGFLSTEPDGTILRANRTFLELGGYDADEIAGRRFDELLPPGARIYYETHYAPLLRMQGSVRELALELVRGDGARVPVLVNATLARGEGDRPELVRITVFDASDRRRYERELLRARNEAEARAAAASALAHVAEGVVLVDEDGRLALLNPAAERILGAAAADVHGLPMTAVARDWAQLAHRIPVGRADDPAAAPVVVPFGPGTPPRWLAASAIRAPEGVVYTLRDITDERRLADLQEEILATVSHELRTPAAGVHGAAQTLLALGDRVDDEQRRRLLEILVEQTGRLSRVLEDLLLAHSLERGDVRIERSSFDVGAAAGRLVEQTSSWRERRPVALEASPGVVAEGDEARFEQVLTALLDNAFRYGPDGAVVRVSVERVRGSARVVVADEGPGVAPEHRERIFERFFRIDPSHVSGVTGTGLGLYVARELVRRMNGRISLVPGERGATFCVELPLRRTAG